VLGVGIIGGHNFSYNPKSWESFAGYFNGLLSPILAALAAIIAFLSLTHQIRESRKEASLNEQIQNSLKNIELIQRMIDSRWETIVKVCKVDWATEVLYAINKDNLEENLKKNAYLLPEVVVICRLFEDLSQSVQWYTALHKRKIDLENNEFPLREWSHFSTSLIKSQDKKLRFCYVYCQWVMDAASASKISEEHKKEVLIFLSFYEGLMEEGTLYAS